MPTNRVRPPLRQDEANAPDDAGFTVLECLVAFVLFAVLAGASTMAIVNANQTSNSSRDRVTAADLAQQDIQQARSLRDGVYPQAVAAHTVTVGTKRYTVSRSVTACPATTDSNNQALTWQPGQVTSMQVTTTVTWTGSPARIQFATEIAC